MVERDGRATKDGNAQRVRAPVLPPEFAFRPRSPTDRSITVEAMSVAASEELTTSQVDRAGRILRRMVQGAQIEPEAVREALAVAGAYRDLHAYPMQRVTNGVSHYI